jgi:hypothetical protein
LIVLLLRQKTEFSFKKLVEMGNTVDAVYPGIVIACLEILRGKNERPVKEELVFEAWTAWVPSVLTERDFQGSLTALNYSNLNPSKHLLIRLLRAVNNSSHRGVLLEKALGALTHDDQDIIQVIQSLPADIQLDSFRGSDGLVMWKLVREAVFLGMLSAHQEEILREICAAISSEKLEGLLIGDSLPVRSDLLSLVDELTESVPETHWRESREDPEIFLRASFHHWNDWVAIISRFKNGVGSLSETPGPGEWIVAGLVDDRSLETRIPNPENRFDVLFYVSRIGRVDNKRVFFRILFDVVNGCYHSSGAMRCVARAACAALGPSLIADHTESLIDALITRVRRKQSSLDSCHKLIHGLIFQRVSIGSRIDLIRTILRTYRARDFPVWSLRVLLVLAGSLEKPAIQAEQLTPAQMIANELIQRIKYVVTVEDVEKAIFGILICMRSIEIFPVEIQIVKICEVVEVLKVFALPGSTGDENGVRLIVVLEMIPFVSKMEKAVSDFFSSKFVWSMIESIPVSGYSGSVAQKLRETVNKAIGSAPAGFIPESIKNVLEKFIV